MSVYALTSLIFLCGATGGFVNCLLLGAPQILPGYDKKKVWHQGWLGSVILGGLTAVLIWSLYGPSALFDLLGTEPFKGSLSLAQLAGSVLVGMGSTRILTVEAQKVILRHQRDTERATKIKVAKAFKEVLPGEKDQ